MSKKNNLLIWALVDDRAGNKSQCLGVAEALGLEFQIREIEYNAAAALPNFALGASFKGLNESSREKITPPWPDLLISAGRRTTPVARNIKRLNDGNTFLAQVMYPGNAGSGEFDLIAAPSHDQLVPSPNLMTIIGAPHRVTPEALEKATLQWRDVFKDLPRPLIALMVGGSTKRRKFTDGMACDLVRTAGSLGGSLLVTTSRRSEDAADALFDEIDCPCHTFRWGDKGANPYLGYLALADAIIVTGDSVSMCSEACAATVPIYIYAPTSLTTAKHSRLHQVLYDKGHARPLGPLGDKLEKWTHPPLNPAKLVANEIKKRFGI